MNYNLLCWGNKINHNDLLSLPNFNLPNVWNEIILVLNSMYLTSGAEPGSLQA